MDAIKLEPGPRKSNSITSSLEPEIFESWTLVSEETFNKSTSVGADVIKTDAAETNKENLQLSKIPETELDGDISDGISIISDNESAGRSSPQPPLQYPAQNSSGDDHNKIINSGNDPITFFETPPNTPDLSNLVQTPVTHSVLTDQTHLNDSNFPTFNLRCIFYLSVIVAIIAFLSKLRTPEWGDNLKLSDISGLLQRIENLEIKNNEILETLSKISLDIQKYELNSNVHRHKRFAEKNIIGRDKGVNTPLCDGKDMKSCDSHTAKRDEEKLPSALNQNHKNYGHHNQKENNEKLHEHAETEKRDDVKRNNKYENKAKKPRPDSEQQKFQKDKNRSNYKNGKGDHKQEKFGENNKQIPECVENGKKCNNYKQKEFKKPENNAYEKRKQYKMNGRQQQQYHQKEKENDPQKHDSDTCTSNENIEKCQKSTPDNDVNWHEKMMRQREEARTKNLNTKTPTPSETGNWYIDRSTGRKAAREHQPETEKRNQRKRK